mgnify:FL=1
MTMNIEQITPIGNELAIAWDDGIETYLSIEAVRKACPCASCQGEPDAMGRVVRPPVHYGDKSFELLNISHVGGYAVQFRWGDGHGTGIYSYEYLRRLT